MKFFLCVLALVASTSALIPCPPNDEQCKIDTFNYMLENFSGGDPSIGLKSFDPLYSQPMNWTRAQSGGPVTMELYLTNAIDKGYRHFRVDSVKGFGANPEGVHVIKFALSKGNVVHFTADYTSKGSLFGYALKGKGSLNIVKKILNVTITINGKAVERDGEIYLDASDFKLDYILPAIEVILPNLFDGNIQLSSFLQNLFNLSKEFVINQWYDSVCKAYGLEWWKVFQGVFDTVPYNKLVAV